jgi:virulence factor
MRVAMIGLGEIAQKAYLPVLAARSDITLVLVTRDRDRLGRLAATYRLADTYSDVQEAAAAGLDAAFVHTPTESHPAVAGDLLRRGIPVYVDKPLAYDLDRARELVDLATGRGVSLTVGFNRRYAPAYRDLADWPRRDVVLMQKHRVGQPGDIRRVVFDDFIHVADTLRFLGPASALADVTAVVTGGLLHSVAVHLSDGRQLAVGVMNRAAGHTEEVLEVLGPGRKRRVVNLADTTELAGGECAIRRDEWLPVAVQRGFQQICDEFLADVRAGRARSASDALATHVLCEAIVQEIGERDR